MHSCRILFFIELFFHKRLGIGIRISLKIVIISILCNYQQKGVTMFVREILDRLRKLVPEETLRGKYIRQVEGLPQLEDLQDDVCEEAEAMALVYDLERCGV
ncbi:hypothetical protein [Candidatus Magnetominusculus dajiuhuensis]|uniref:hypothetical protein n=1 Tax=Candidatus Magnetominusculus dajiuhuensis TaxID=3137712 RepID=UPI003B42D65A